MELCANSITEWADRCDRTLNHNYTRKRVEDTLGRQAVNWQSYVDFEKQNMLLLVTACEGDELAGFVLYLLYVHPHHPDAHIAHCTFLIVSPGHRGKGLGRKLIEYAVPILRDRKCTHIMHGRRMVYDVEPLFPKLGFVKFEESYVMEIG